ncbi:MAG: hypothetical protein CL840_01635 [Crocinitomicaceae bacterium]|nr:hypothetical protein [Crocinitomicaceae bacterium]|tara:strand:- start:10141 stop:10617 length:477 start_codon:yes stop_codon:yes gene_type:complete
MASYSNKDLMEIKESMLGHRIYQLVGVIFIGFGAYKFEINPTIFSLLLLVGSLMVITSRSSLVLSRNSLVEKKGRIFDYFVKPKAILMTEISEVEYERPTFKWKLLALSFVAPGFRIKTPKRLNIKMKSGKWIQLNLSNYDEAKVQAFFELVKVSRKD